MTKREKRIARLKQVKGDVPFKLVGQVLQDQRYALVRITGSHFTFKKSSCQSVNVPVHNGKVKPVYVKRIIKRLKL